MPHRTAARPDRPTVLPGARVSCALLTVFTILLAWPSPPTDLPVLVRPGYFALLFCFFWRTGRDYPELRSQAMRLVRSGFFVLWLSFTVGAVIHLAELEPLHAGFAYLRAVCERGAMFLLGTTLISYGLMLWIPQVLHSHRRLGEDVVRAETTQSKLEERLIDADRRGLLAELAATIAHDLRNPLAIVKGTAESLCRKSRTPAEIEAHTDVIRRNIEKADRTIAALIDLGRPRAGEPTNCAATEILDEVAALVRVEANRRQITIDVVADRSVTPPVLRADRTLLAQALLNLVLNAMQATSGSGRIVLRARSWRNAHGVRTVLAIEDRGGGLPPTVRDHLFTPFFTTKPTGTGLGLSSCRRIAKELGGTLGLYPRHRGGARALVSLPAADATTAPTEGERACLVTTS